MLTDMGGGEGAGVEQGGRILGGGGFFWIF